MEHYFKGLSITTGAVRYRDLCYLLTTKDSLSKEKIPHTRIYEIDQGRIGGIDLDWIGVSGTVCHFPEEKFIALGETGNIYTLGGKQIKEEQPVTQEEILFREIRGISKGRAYAVGPARKVFRRDAPDKWSDISAPMPEPENLLDAGFESIDGKTESDIYAVGWGGEIWHFDGNYWEKIDYLTNLALYKIRYAGDGFFYACGQMGTVLKGYAGQWEIVENNVTVEDFWGIEWFAGNIYISSLYLLYVLENGNLSPVDFGEVAPPSTCYHLSAADGILWSVGAKDIMQFDGNEWTRIL